MEMENELNLCLKRINDERIREWTGYWLKERTPDYFWTVPASSTGKYHPKYAAEEGGLVRHTKVVFNIALELLENKVWPFSKRERDLALSAILLHDTRKLGMPKQEYTVDNHADLVADAIKEECEEGSIRWQIAELVGTHMGRWGTAEVENELQYFVHICDFLSSRKFLEVDFSRMGV